MAVERSDKRDTVIPGEAQLVLADKRTSLAAMRTGIAVCALPLSVLSLLMATSRYYSLAKVVYLLIPMSLVCVALLVLSAYLIHQSAVKLDRQDRLLCELAVGRGGGLDAITLKRCARR